MVLFNMFAKAFLKKMKSLGKTYVPHDCFHLFLLCLEGFMFSLMGFHVFPFSHFIRFRRIQCYDTGRSFPPSHDRQVKKTIPTKHLFFNGDLAYTLTEGVPRRASLHRVQGSVDAAETPSEMMPQSHLAPFTLFSAYGGSCAFYQTPTWVAPP